jgi:hypothetical protein
LKVKEDKIKALEDQLRNKENRIKDFISRQVKSMKNLKMCEEKIDQLVNGKRELKNINDLHVKEIRELTAIKDKNHISKSKYEEKILHMKRKFKTSDVL